EPGRAGVPASRPRGAEQGPDLDRPRPPEGPHVVPDVRAAKRRPAPRAVFAPEGRPRVSPGRPSGVSKASEPRGPPPRIKEVAGPGAPIETTRPLFREMTTVGVARV